ncbi:hypothetical protein E4635_07840 [Flavobacterium humi]|uniref:Uncharacterized protein n=1 Tax=Flavobacterium humi TaxID=2562683 RepID=A0A4Z0L7B9_9FLAO|nr:hypothetical protein E4635_07840 [Flavobacterium humi]
MWKFLRTNTCCEAARGKKQEARTKSKEQRAKSKEQRAKSQEVNLPDLSKHSTSPSQHNP